METKSYQDYQTMSYDKHGCHMIFVVVNIMLDNKKYLCVFEVIQQQQQLLFINAVKNGQQSHPPLIGDT